MLANKSLSDISDVRLTCPHSLHSDTLKLVCGFHISYFPDNMLLITFYHIAATAAGGGDKISAPSTLSSWKQIHSERSNISKFYSYTRMSLLRKTARSEGGRQPSEVLAQRGSSNHSNISFALK